MFQLLRQWCYNALLWYLLYVLLRTLWFELIKWLLNIIFSLKIIKVLHLKSPVHQFLALTLSSIVFFQFLDTAFHNLNLKLSIKQYYKNDLLNLILAPQLGGGWQQSYSTKTRQAGSANHRRRIEYLSMLPMSSLSIMSCLCLISQLNEMSMSNVK